MGSDRHLYSLLSAQRFGVILIPSRPRYNTLLFILISSYDGEGIYRVFLFSSPWCAFIIARRFAELGNRLCRRSAGP